ncbi:Hypothetical_protein [Hexamita inflata]|uniref:Hypothetical_protein n=1 Tax=Hexamita inflata TaxID=28002 RepID=A0AA86TE79_9EUKA|nr:Hypothetical protein HINF_LOCUS3914 [Hexamita inflata]
MEHQSGASPQFKTIIMKHKTFSETVELPKLPESLKQTTINLNMSFASNTKLPSLQVKVADNLLDSKQYNKVLTERDTKTQDKIAMDITYKAGLRTDKEESAQGRNDTHLLIALSENIRRGQQKQGAHERYRSRLMYYVNNYKIQQVILLFEKKQITFTHQNSKKGIQQPEKIKIQSSTLDMQQTRGARVKR